MFCVKVTETHRKGTHSRENSRGKTLPSTDSDKVEHSNVMDGKNNDQSRQSSCLGTTATEGLDTILEVTLNTFDKKIKQPKQLTDSD